MDHKGNKDHKPRKAHKVNPERKFEKRHTVHKVCMVQRERTDHMGSMAYTVEVSDKAGILNTVQRADCMGSCTLCPHMKMDPYSKELRMIHFSYIVLDSKVKLARHSTM